MSIDVSAVNTTTVPAATATGVLTMIIITTHT